MNRIERKEAEMTDAQRRALLVVKEGRALKIPSLVKLRQLVEKDWAE